MNPADVINQAFRYLTLGLGKDCLTIDQLVQLKSHIGKALSEKLRNQSSLQEGDIVKRAGDITTIAVVVKTAMRDGNNSVPFSSKRLHIHGINTKLRSSLWEGNGYYKGNSYYKADNQKIEHTVEPCPGCERFK